MVLSNRKTTVKIIKVLSSKKSLLTSIYIIKNFFNLKKILNTYIYINLYYLMQHYFSKKKESNRLDITDLPLITIDGYDSKDFDDAIYAKQVNKNYALFISISDVSYYVSENSYLDKKAYEICNSIYMHQKVLPMFPDFLSSNLCSLKPNKKRLSILCEILLSERGEILKYEFHKTIMKSRMDFNYNEISKILMLQKDHSKGLYKNLYNLVNLLYKISNILKTRKKKNNTIEFFKNETEMRFSILGKLEKIGPIKKKSSYKIVEEFMILANLLVSNFLSKNNIPFIKRIHEPPSKKKSILLNKFVSLINKKVKNKIYRYFNIKFYTKIVNFIKHKPIFFIFQNILLNAFEKAVYNVKKDGHFGLDINSYTHFTSPIRRYSDLIIHRIVKCYLASSSHKYSTKFLSYIGKDCSLYEIKTNKLNKKIKFNLISIFFKKNISKYYEARIVDIQKFGFIINISDIGIYGLISNKYMFKCNKKRIFKINDKIDIKLLYIQEEKEIINFFII